MGAVQPFINAGTNLYNAAAPEMNKLKGETARVGEGVKAQAGAWGNAKNWLSAKASLTLPPEQLNQWEIFQARQQGPPKVEQR